MDHQRGVKSLPLNPGGENSLASVLSSFPAFGFGISGALASPLVSERACETLIRHTLSKGGRIFDTAPSYGGGIGEARLGKALAGNPDAFVMTKGGLLSSGLTKRTRDFSPAGLHASINASLKRLARDRIDLLWLHGPSRQEITPELLDLLHTLKTAGNVRYFGIAGRTDDILTALDYSIFEAVMFPLNAHSGYEATLWAQRARSANRIVFAIEVFKGIQSENTVTRGKLWRTAQRMAQLNALPPSGVGLSVSDAASWAYGPGGADIVLTTTTSTIHLSENLDILATRRLRAV